MKKGGVNVYQIPLYYGEFGFSTSKKNESISLSFFTFILYFCGDGRNRTADTRIFSPLLYRLSYITNLFGGGKDINKFISPRSCSLFFEKTSIIFV